MREKTRISQSVRVLLAFPLLGLLMTACTGVPAGVEPVKNLDAQRYQGRWYEIMRLDHAFERGLTHVTADYQLRGDGTLNVINRGFNLRTCRWQEVKGEATFLRGPRTGSLAVTFFWPLAGGYHILELDEKRYRWSIVAGPTRDYLWILAREPDLSPQERARLMEKVRQLGFPVGDLILVDQGPSACTL